MYADLLEKNNNPDYNDFDFQNALGMAMVEQFNQRSPEEKIKVLIMAYAMTTKKEFKSPEQAILSMLDDSTAWEGMYYEKHKKDNGDTVDHMKNNDLLVKGFENTFKSLEVDYFE